MSYCPTRTVVAVTALSAALLSGVPAAAQPQANGCGDLANAFGPYDYRTERGNNLWLVESTHFKPDMEALIRGLRGSPVGSELDYTLRAFPNHHRALVSMMRLGEKQKTTQPVGARYSVECYFDRALRFRPDDTITRMLYARFLSKNNRDAEAIKQLEAAVSTAGDNAFTYYNIGLIYFDMKLYDRAAAQARKAAALGFERPDLRVSLQQVGKWVDADVANAPPPGASSPP